MAIDMTPEQRATGEANFNKTVEHLGLNRREFLKAGIVGAGALGGSAAAVYFGYQSLHGRPVKAALIGAGDEGGVLVGEHTPEFLEFVAVCDIRPYNLTRIVEGDPKVALRKGFKKIYGNKAGSIKKYTDYKKMLEECKDVEAVVIATPLHLHAKMAIDCMQAGKHVLCEKLMARNVGQCKEMIRVAKETKRILSIGHQRHYSMLYAHAQDVVKSGVLGDVKTIRALWHRNFSWPASFNANEFTWAFDKPDLAQQQPGVSVPKIRDGWYQPVLRGDYEGLEQLASEMKMSLKEMLQSFGFDSVEQLVRWRLYETTGGGLMAELGSHQLDAASIFLGKVKPLAVVGVGTHSFFGDSRQKGDSRPNPREIDDHVFVTYEFPGKDHPRGPGKGKDKEDICVVSYSSISTNSFEQYGECLMGTRGTMIVEAEQRVFLFTEKDPTKKGGDQRAMTVDVSTIKKDAAAADSSSTWGGPSASVSAAQAGTAARGGPISRGYREEMEDFAYCIRTWDEKLGYARNEDGSYKQRLPRCHGEVAMADAIIALTANLAMKNRSRIEFKPEWFDAESDQVPEKQG